LGEKTVVRGGNGSEGMKKEGKRRFGASGRFRVRAKITTLLTPFLPASQASARAAFGSSFVKKDSTSVKFKAFCTLCSLLTIAVGVVHVSNELNDFCGEPSETRSCFGPWLIWQSGGDGLSDVNLYWRSVFSFNTSVFFELWTPIFLGLFSLHMYVPSLLEATAWEHEQWRFNSGVYLFTALFGSLGYAGNLGILVGFGNVVAR
jgi:hypothetical protein